MTLDETLRLHEETQTDKIDKIFELIDNVRLQFGEENISLREQVERLRENGKSYEKVPLTNGNVRSSSQQTAEREARISIVDAKKNASMTRLGNSKLTIGPITSKAAEPLGEQAKDLLEKLNVVVGSIEKYREVCPPISQEARMVHKRMINELDVVVKDTRKLVNHAALSIDNLSAAGGSVGQTGEMSKLSPRTPPSPTQESGLVKSLQSLNKKLERKCEDRKISLKKLYCIVVEKDRQLKNACIALERLREGSEELSRRMQGENELLEDKTSAMEHAIDRLSSLVRGIQVAIIPNQTFGEGQNTRMIPEGSLEYSFTRRYELLHRSGTGNKSIGQGAEDNRRSLASANGNDDKNLVQITEPQVDILEGLDEEILSILQLARERFSYSQDEDPDDNLVAMMKIVRDWGFLIEECEEARASKDHAIKAQEELELKLESREQAHAAAIRSYETVKTENHSRTSKLEVELQRANSKIKELEAKPEPQVETKKSNEQQSPRPPTPSQQRRVVTADKQTGVSIEDPNTARLVALNEKLRDKLSLLESTSSERFKEFEVLKDQLVALRAEAKTTKASLRTEIQATWQSVDTCFGKLSTFAVRETAGFQDALKSVNAQLQSALLSNEKLKASNKDIQAALEERSNLIKLKDKELKSTRENYEREAELGGKLRKEVKALNDKLKAADDESRKQMEQLTSQLETLKQSEPDYDEEMLIETSRKLGELEISHKKQAQELKKALNAASTLKSQKEELEEEADHLRKLADELRINIQQALENKSNFESQTIELLEKLNVKEDELALLRKEISKKESTIENLKGKLTEAQAKVVRSDDTSVKELETALQDKLKLEQVQVDLQKELDAALSDLHSQQTDNEGLGLELVRTRDLLEQKELELSSAEKRAQKLENQLAETKQSLTNEQKEIIQFKERVEQSNQEIQSYITKIEVLEQENHRLASLDNKLENQTEEVELLNKEIAKKTSRISELENHIVRIKAESQGEIKETQEALEEEIAHMIEKLEEARLEQEEMTKVIADKDQDLAFKDKEIVSQKQTLSNVSAQLDQYKVLIDESQATTQKLLEQSASKASVLEKKLQVKEAELQEVKERLDTITKHSDDLEKQLTKQVKSLSSEKENEVQTVSSLKTEVIKLKSQIGELQVLKDNLDAELQSVRSELKICEDKRHELEQQCEKYSIEVTKVTSLNSELLSRVETANNEKQNLEQQLVDLGKDFLQSKTTFEETESGLVDQIANLDSQISELAGSVTELHTALASEREECDRLSRQLLEARSALKETEVLANQRRTEMEELHQRNVLEKSELDGSVKREYEKMMVAVRIKDDLIEQAEIKAAAFKKKAEEGEKLLKEVSEKLKQAELQSTEQEVEHLKALTGLKLGLAIKTKSLEEATSEINELQKQVASLGIEVTQTRGQLRILEESKSEKDIEITSLGRGLTELRNSLQNEQSDHQKTKDHWQEQFVRQESHFNEAQEALINEIREADEIKEKALEAEKESRLDIQAKDLELIRLKQSKDELEEQIREKDEQLTKLNQELSKKLVDTSSVVKTKDVFIKQLETRLAEREREYERVSQDASSINKKMENLFNEIEIRDSNIETLTANIDALSSQTQEATQESRRLSDELRQVRKQLRDTEDQLKSAIEKANRNSELSQDKSAFIEQMKKERDELLEKYKAIENVVQSERSSSKALKDEIESRERDILSLRDLYEKSIKQFKTFEKDLLASSKQVHEKETELSLASKREEQLRSRIAALELEIDNTRQGGQQKLLEGEEGMSILRQALERERQERSKDRATLERERDTALEAVIKEKKTREWIEGERDKASNQLKLQTEKLAECQTNLSSKQTELEEKDEDVLRLRNDVRTMADSITRLQSKLEVLTEEQADHKEAHTEALFRISSLEQENTDLAQQVASSGDIFDQLELLKSQLSTLSDQLVEKSDTVDRYVIAMRESELAVERLTSEIVKVKEERNSLDNQMEEARSRMKAAEEAMSNAQTDRNRERKEKETMAASLEDSSRKLEMISALDKENSSRLKDSKEEVKKVTEKYENLEKQLFVAKNALKDQEVEILSLKKDKKIVELKLDELQSEMKKAREREVEVDRIKSSIATADLEKSELGGRAKELAESLEKNRQRLDDEIEKTGRYKQLLEAETSRKSALEVKLKSAQEALELSRNSVRVDFKPLDKKALWMNLVLKCKLNNLWSRHIATQLIVRRMRPWVQRAKKLQEDNTKLAQDIMVQTRKLIQIERSRSDIEAQLTAKESQLIEAHATMTNKTLKSEADVNASVRESVETKRFMSDPRVQAYKLTLRDIVLLIADMLELPPPNIDNMNDRSWDNYVPKLKTKLFGLINMADDAKTSAQNYQMLLEVQTRECSELREIIVKLKEEMKKIPKDSQAAGSNFNHGIGDIDIDIKPSESSQLKQPMTYSSREKDVASPILYDMPDSDRNQVVSDNMKLIERLEKLQNEIDNKEDEIDEYKNQLATLNERIIRSEVNYREARGSLEEFVDNLGRNDDRERRAWERAFKTLGYPDAKYKETIARINKLIGRKKSLV